MTSSSIPKGRISAINLSQNYTQVSSVEKENQSGWVDYGEKNMFAEYCIELAEQSPVHGSVVRSTSQMIAGKTITSKDVGTASLIKSLGIDKARNNTALDIELHGGFYWEVIYANDGTLHSIEHLPFECCRVGINKETGEVNGAWFSKDWKNIRKARNKPKFIPLFTGKKQEKSSLQNGDKEEGVSRQIYFKFKNSSAASYYGKPDYISALNYIELSRQLSLFHVNNIQNGLFPSFVVNMNNGIPETTEEMDAQKRDIERNISGASNAGKFIVTWAENKDRSTEFIPFPTNDNDKVYQLYEETCTRQILIAHRVTSPLLFGIREGSGLGSNKDEMESALKIFNEQVVQPSQEMIIEAAEEMTQMLGSSHKIEIVNNGQEMQGTPTATTSDTSAADVSYNGAQISSAIDIIAKVKEGILTEEQATIFLIQFLQLPEDVAKSFFAGGGALAVEKLSKFLSAKKKSSESCCVELSENEIPEFTEQEEEAWMLQLDGVGEVVDEEEWELLEEGVAGSAAEEKEYLLGVKNVNMAFANPNQDSDWGDSGLYKLRYKYSENINPNSRKFCVKEATKSRNGVVYRYEDIAIMSEKGVNGNFAPSGERTYDIFTWKGGVYCHHSWLRRIYFRKRKDGKFLPDNGLKNDEQVPDKNYDFLKPKGKESIRPINTPNRGSLK